MTMPDDNLSTNADSNIEQLARLYERQRRVGDLLWMLTTVILLLVGVVAWLLTRNVAYFAWWLLIAIFPAIGFVSNHWFMFRNGPLEAQKRIEAMERTQRRYARLSGLINGPLVALGSIVILGVIVSNFRDATELTLGVAVASFAILGGIGMFLWALRDRSKSA